MDVQRQVAKQQVLMVNELARLWARNTTFDSVDIGDELPILVKWETAETIEKFRGLVMVGKEYTDAGPPSSGNTAAASQALLSYATELLEKAFPLKTITANGSSLTLRVLKDVMPEDTISLSGKVTGKQSEKDLPSVQCAITIENQDNVLVAEIEATIAL